MNGGKAASADISRPAWQPFATTRSRRIPLSSSRSLAKIAAEFKSQAPFTPGWRFGEAQLADRLAAKDKTLPRVLDGDSAHPRTPGA